MSSDDPFKNFNSKFEQANQSMINSLKSLNDIPNNFRRQQEETLRQIEVEKQKKELEEERRHNEIVGVLENQVTKLQALLEDSNNAIEQRNTVIRFMIEEIIKSEQPVKEKKNLLLDMLVPVATVSSGASDLVGLIQAGLKLLDK